MPLHWKILKDNYICTCLESCVTCSAVKTFGTGCVNHCRLWLFSRRSVEAGRHVGPLRLLFILFFFLSHSFLSPRLANVHAAAKMQIAVEPFCWRLIALIAFVLHLCFSGKWTSVSSWVIHLHSSSQLFFIYIFLYLFLPRNSVVVAVGAGQGWMGGSLPQTTLRGAGLDDISWNKAAREPQSGSLLMERVRRREQPAANETRRKFQYVTRRKVVAADTLGHLSSVVCRRGRMCRLPVTGNTPPPALNTPRYSSSSALALMQIFIVLTVFNTRGRF